MDRFHSLTGSLLDLVTKTEVIVRGLYHAAATDLEITLLHQEHSCVLSAATSSSTETTGNTSSSSGVTRPAGVQFGIPEERRYMRGFGPNPGMWACGRVGGGLVCASHCLITTSTFSSSSCPPPHALAAAFNRKPVRNHDAYSRIHGGTFAAGVLAPRYRLRLRLCRRRRGECGENQAWSCPSKTSFISAPGVQGERKEKISWKKYGQTVGVTFNTELSVACMRKKSEVRSTENFHKAAGSEKNGQAGCV